MFGEQIVLTAATGAITGTGVLAAPATAAPAPAQEEARTARHRPAARNASSACQPPDMRPRQGS